MMQFFSNTFKGTIAQVPAVIDDKLLKPLTEVVHGFAGHRGRMAATSCRIASFNCSIVPGRRIQNKILVLYILIFVVLDSKLEDKKFYTA